MSALCLSEQLIPLQMFIEPIFNTAHQFELGEAVSLSFGETDAVFLNHHDVVQSLVFNEHQLIDNTVPTWRILDEWLPPYPAFEKVKQRLYDEPNLVISGLPVTDGFVDMWRHQGELQMTYCEELGSGEHHRAMLLAALTLGFPVQDAVVLARAYARCALDDKRESLIHWPDALSYFPQAVTPTHPLSERLLGVKSFSCQFPAVEKEPLALYAVLESSEWIERVVKRGIKTAQLRIKDPHCASLYEHITQAVKCGEHYHSQIFINDHWSLAIQANAYGVHLGQEDLLDADVQALSQAHLRLGISTHGYFEILRALEYRPSYIALGHIFPTTTKEMVSEPQGLSRLALYQALLLDVVPTVAIGGIDLSNIAQVLRCKVDGIAVVRALTQAPDLDEAIAQLQGEIAQAHFVTGGVGAV